MRTLVELFRRISWIIFYVYLHRLYPLPVVSVFLYYPLHILSAISCICNQFSPLSVVAAISCICNQFYPLSVVAATSCIRFLLNPLSIVSATSCSLFLLHPLLDVSATICIRYQLYPLLVASASYCTVFASLVPQRILLYPLSVPGVPPFVLHASLVGPV